MTFLHPGTFPKLSWTQMTKNFVQKVSLYDGFTPSHPIDKDGRPLEGTCACASPRHWLEMQTHLDPHMKWLEQMLYECVNLLWLFSSNFCGISLLQIRHGHWSMMIMSYTDILLSDCALSFSFSLCYWIFFLMEIESVSHISTESTSTSQQWSISLHTIL